jgi:hypothetical protein
MTHRPNGISSVTQRHLIRASNGISAVASQHVSREPHSISAVSHGSDAVARSFSPVSFRSFLQESIHQSSTSGAAVPRLLETLAVCLQRQKFKRLYES